MNKQSIITALLALVVMAGQAQVKCHVVGTVAEGTTWLSSYLVWVGVKFSNAKEEELLINDASQIGSKKFDFSIE